ncbi:hypothetical protein MUP59_00960 [Candidatus Bathyarchaeota archaeon]|nr:hypothetical protein [Candidatus Bathyarchaeota archaeon]
MDSWNGLCPFCGHDQSIPIRTIERKLEEKSIDTIDVVACSKCGRVYKVNSALRK